MLICNLCNIVIHETALSLFDCVHNFHHGCLIRFVLEFGYVCPTCRVDMADVDVGIIREHIMRGELFDEEAYDSGYDSEGS